jgi:hypothetical protein
LRIVDLASSTARTWVWELADPFAVATLDLGITHDGSVLEWFEQVAILLPDRQAGPPAPGA